MNLFLINPKAGKGKKAKELIPSIERYCSGQNIPYEIYITKGQYDAIGFLKEYLKSGENVRIYACGGDGTLFEAVNGAYGFQNAEIGIFPLGSGNDFVRLFEPKEKFLNIPSQLEGESVELDLIRCGKKYAISQCSMGVDAEVCMNQKNFKKLPFISGELAFGLSAVYTITKKIGAEFVVTVDGEKPYKDNLFFCLAANSKWYGGGYMGAPDALPNDGFIDLVTVKNEGGGKIELLKLLSKYKKGEHKNLPVTKIRHCKKVKVETADTAAVNIDGECHYATLAEFEIIPKGIKFIIPKGARMMI